MSLDKFSGISEKQLWFFVAISIVLHIILAVIITRLTINIHKQAQSIETYLVTSLPNSVNPTDRRPGTVAPTILPLQTQVKNLTIPQSALTAASPPVSPVNTAALVNAGHIKRTLVKEQISIQNPVQKASVTSENKSTDLSSGAQTPFVAHQNITGVKNLSVQGANENREDMRLGDVGAPRYLHKEKPDYPIIAQKLGKEGKVVARLTLDETGHQKNIEVVEHSGFGFTDAAVVALKKSTFSPAERNGKPIKSRVLITVWFRLTDD